MLTGKAKQDFDKWFIVNFATHNFGQWNKTDKEHFYNLPLSMQWGVYVDFFDSLNIFLNIEPPQDRDKSFCKTEYEVYVNQEWVKDEDEINEARKAAIEKANEIYN